MTTFKTEDGYTFKLVNGEWTDEDMVFESKNGLLIDEMGELLSGVLTSSKEQNVVYVELEADDKRIAFVGDYDACSDYISDQVTKYANTFKGEGEFMDLCEEANAWYTIEILKENECLKIDS